MVGEREKRMDGEGDDVQVGLGAGAGAGVEGEGEGKIEEEGPAPEPGHHQEIHEARHEGGRIAQREQSGAAVFARGQRREARHEQRVRGHRHGGRGRGHGVCGGRGDVDYEGRQSWVCPK